MPRGTARSRSSRALAAPRPALAASGARRPPAVRRGSRSVRRGATRHGASPFAPSSSSAAIDAAMPHVRASIEERRGVQERQRAADVVLGQRPDVPARGTNGTAPPLRRRDSGPSSSAAAAPRSAAVSSTRAARPPPRCRRPWQVVGDEAVLCATPRARARGAPRRRRAPSRGRPRRTRRSPRRRSHARLRARPRGRPIVRSRARSRRTRQSTSSPATEAASAASAISRSAGRSGAADAPCARRPGRAARRDATGSSSDSVAARRSRRAAPSRSPCSTAAVADHVSNVERVVAHRRRDASGRSRQLASR